MIESKKGCVYFFRHVGLEPIKIGYSENESPINRFQQFKTYAPFGAEIIGFIQTDEAKGIESKLHQKYSSKRLDGEWFLISEEQIQNEINFYTSKEDIKQKNDFQIAWAKHLSIKESEKQQILTEASLNNKDKFEYFKKLYLKNNKINRTHMAKKFGVSRRTIITWIKQIEY
jgi:hypothetical protein